MTLAHDLCYTVLKARSGHTYAFRYDSSPKSLYALFVAVFQLVARGELTLEEAALIRGDVTFQIEGRCEGV